MSEEAGRFTAMKKDYEAWQADVLSDPLKLPAYIRN